MGGNRRLAFLLVCPAAVCLIGQQPPVIRTNVHVVEVTIIATDAKNLTPGKLLASDFRVWDNGKEQQVASLDLLTSHAGAGAAELPPNTYSNRLGADKRPQVLSIILLDALNTHYRKQPRVREAVAQVLAQIQPDERVGIFTLGNTLRTLHGFTSDRASLLAKLARYRGELPSLADPVEDLDDLFDDSAASAPFQAMADTRRVTRTLDSLAQLASHVKGVPGRKNLLWVSGSFPMVSGMPDMEYFFKHGGPNSSPFALLKTFGEEMDRTVRALNAANVAVYPIDSRGLSTNPKAAINQGAMITLADETGGKAFYNRNDIDRSVRLALDDSRETYLLTYSPKALLRDGSFHQIRVETSRPGVRLRCRRGYYAPEGEQAAAAGAADRLSRALSSPVDISDLGIRARVKQAHGPADEIGVAVYVDPADLDLVRTSTNWAGALRIELLQTGAADETFGGIRQDASLDLSPEVYRRAATEGLRFDLRFKREAKASAVRIGVVDERGGGAGSLSIPLPAVR